MNVKALNKPGSARRTASSQAAPRSWRQALQGNVPGAAESDPRCSSNRAAVQLEASSGCAEAVDRGSSQGRNQAKKRKTNRDQERGWKPSVIACTLDWRHRRTASVRATATVETTASPSAPPTLNELSTSPAARPDSCSATPVSAAICEATKAAPSPAPKSSSPRKQVVEIVPVGRHLGRAAGRRPDQGHPGQRHRPRTDLGDDGLRRVGADHGHHGHHRGHQPELDRRVAQHLLGVEGDDQQHPSMHMPAVSRTTLPPTSDRERKIRSGTSGPGERGSNSHEQREQGHRTAEEGTMVRGSAPALLGAPAIAETSSEHARVVTVTRSCDDQSSVRSPRRRSRGAAGGVRAAPRARPGR